MRAGSEKLVPKSTLRLRTAIVLWLGIGAAGILWLGRYASMAGPETNCSKHWPSELAFDRSEGLPALVVFVHPHCACTASTLGEVERLVAEIPEKMQTFFVFGYPKSMEADWVESPLWNRAGSIPSSKRILDPGGSIASIFGVLISGHCLLYSPAGELVFDGGLTPSRAHEGEAFGRVAVRQLLRGEEPIKQNTPVFGCELVRETPEAASDTSTQEAHS